MSSGRREGMARWVVLIVAAFVAVYAVTVLATGRPEFLIPAAVLVAIVLGFALFNLPLTRKQLARHGGSADRAVADKTDAIPAPATFPDDTRLGSDTAEA